MNDVDSQNNLEKGQSLQLTMISRINYKAIVIKTVALATNQLMRSM